MPPSLFRRIGRRGNKWGTPKRNAEKDLISPALPQMRRDAPIPKLRSRFEKILNLPMGQSRSWAAQGWASEILVCFRFRLACGLAREGARLDAPRAGGCIETFLSIPSVWFFTRRICER